MSLREQAMNILIGLVVTLGFVTGLIFFAPGFTKETSEVKVTDYVIYQTKESKVVQIKIKENKCEIMTESGDIGNLLFHHIDFEVCPVVKIGDKVKVTMEVMK